MHDLRCPVGFTGIRQASAPAPGVRLELGPLGRCPRPLPRAPTLKTTPYSASSWLDMRDLLFPKEQGPGLNPNPPARSGPFFLAWWFLVVGDAASARTTR
jgi:hypothetical protein